VLGFAAIGFLDNAISPFKFELSLFCTNPLLQLLPEPENKFLLTLQLRLN
jgi:hypothetical protein